MMKLHEIYNDYVQHSNTASHYKKMYFDAKKQGEETREAKNPLEFEKIDQHYNARLKSIDQT